jgi:PAS domain S-box-containing protein
MNVHHKANIRDARLLNQIIALLVVCAAGLGILAFLGWILGLNILASFDADLIPMAPSTALLFVLFGLALFFRNRLSRNRGVYTIGVIIGLLGLTTALLLFYFSSMRIYPQIEHLGISIVGTIAGAPVGHMSPLTAICFVVISLSFLATLTSDTGRPKRALAAFWSAFLTVLASLLFLIAYLFGAPLMYGGGVVPPALSTSLAFLFLALGLLGSAGLQVWSFDGQKKAATSRTAYVFMLVFILLASGIVAVGYFYYSHYEKQHKTEIEHQLAAIADLKVDDLVQWRKERWGDAAVFYQNANFSIRVAQYFAKPKSVDAQEKLLTWMRKALEEHQHDRISLYDAGMVDRISYPAGIEPTDSLILRQASNVLRSRQMAFQDFYRDEHDGRVYLNIIVPILDEQKGNRAIGVLAMRIDPEVYLYPLVSRWPTSSRTAETLLLRREGNDALFLNELKFRKNTALTLRSPLTDETMPAVKVVLGKEGIVEGVDYRRVPVLANMRAVPNSPWFLVARMDLSEVYDPLRERLWMTVLLIGALLVGAGAGVGMIWRQQRIKILEERYESAERIRKLNRVYAMLSDINQAIVRIREPQALFEKACSIAVEKGNFPLTWIGLVDESTEEIHVAASAGGSGVSLEKIRFSSKIDAALRRGEHVVSNKIGQGEPRVPYHEVGIEHGFRSAASFPLRVHSRTCGTVNFFAAEPDFFDEEELKLLDELAMDISFAMEFAEKEAERSQAEKALRLSDQKFSLMFEKAAFAAVLSKLPEGVIVDVNEAWVKMSGYTKPEVVGKTTLELGINPDVDARARITAEFQAKGSVRDQELTLRMKSGESRIVSANLDLVDIGGQKYILNTAQDITDRKRAEEEIRKAENRYRSTLDYMLEGCQIISNDWRYLYLNDVAAAQGRFPKAKLLGRTMMEIYPGIENTQFFAELRRCMEKRIHHRMENEFTYPDGSKGWFNLNIEPVPEGAFILSEDITKEKQLNEELRIHREHLEELVEERTAQLQAANKELESFSYSVSHDLRAPLRHIDGFADLLTKHAHATLDDTGRRFLGTISDSAKQMGILIDELLVFSRMGRVEMKTTEVNSDTLVRNVIAGLIHDIQKRKINWTIGVLPSVQADPAMLRLVFQNLLENAVKYTRPSEDTVIEIQCTPKPNECEFFVKDNGVGFDMQYLDKLFGVFQRLHRVDEFEGTGIGLANVRRIIQRHGGKTWAEGKVGEGATFYFSLPNHQRG